MPAQTQQNYENPPLSVKTKKPKGEWRKTTHKPYTIFINKVFDYLLINPFKYGYNLQQAPVSRIKVFHHR